MYEGNLLEVPRCHPEQDQIFFNRLDAELSKINRFYSMKEAEYIAQATRLENQLLNLFEVQESLARQSVKMGAYIKKLPDQHGINADSSGDEELNFGESSTHPSTYVHAVLKKVIYSNLASIWVRMYASSQPDILTQWWSSNHLKSIIGGFCSLLGTISMGFRRVSDWFVTNFCDGLALVWWLISWWVN